MERWSSRSNRMRSNARGLSERRCMGAAGADGREVFHSSLHCTVDGRIPGLMRLVPYMKISNRQAKQLLVTDGGKWRSSIRQVGSAGLPGLAKEYASLYLRLLVLLT